MSALEMKVDALLRFVSAETADGRDAALRVIRGLVTVQPSTDTKCRDDVDDAIREVLFRVGVPDSLFGHRYLMSALAIVVKDPNAINGIARNLYVDVARQHNTTAPRIERGIRHAIEVACDRGDFEVLEGYFGNTMSSTRGKPTNREFIARIANVIRRELQS